MRLTAPRASDKTARTLARSNAHLGSLKVALATREYPNEIYGGAGVHVKYLAQELRKLIDLEVHCFGKARAETKVRAYEPWSALEGSEPHLAALRTVSVDLQIAANLQHAEVVHSHTWYANLAGHFAKLLYGSVHVMTSHSLEPLRPWKAEQLGGGYALSQFCERTAIAEADAVIAVSEGMRRDILSCYPEVDPTKVPVIYNGVDTEEYQPDPSTAALQKHGVDPNLPSVVFVGRITRQKGVVHLLEAARLLAPEVQLVLCAGEPDTKELGREVSELVAELERERGKVLWIDTMLPREELVQLLSHARVFACPSVYEPFGIVNVEAMACGAAVVASAVGGIPEVVSDGETGYLVPYAADAQGNPKDARKFAADFAERLNEVATNAALAKRMGEAGRDRARSRFSWKHIAQKTAELYAELSRGK